MNIDNLQKLSHLSAKLQDALSSDQTTQFIKDALQLANQDESKLNTLTDIVDKVLLLELPVSRFPIEVEKNLKISSAETKIITSVIQNKIFTPLKNELGQFQKDSSPQTQRKVTTTSNISALHFTQSGQRKANTSLHPKSSVAPASPVPLISSVSSTTLATSSPAKEQKPTNQQSGIAKPPLPHLPEPAEVAVKKAEIKTTPLKNFSVSPQYQKQAAEIKNKLLAAMMKRAAPPKIVETMKQLSQKGWKNIKKLSQKNQKKQKKSVKLNTNTFSQIFSGGEGKSFSEKKKKNSKKKPFIFNVRLKKEKKEIETLKEEKPISYSKYKPKNPFGNA